MARYTIEEIELPSVTEILGILDKPALVQWAANQVVEYIKQNCEFEHDNGDYYAVLPEELNDARFKYREVSSEACDNGTTVHSIIEQYILAKMQNKTVDLTQYRNYNDAVENAFLAFLDWENKHNVLWLESEKTVWHQELLYAGTLDAICMIDGVETMIDFKSSKGFYDTFAMQLAAYMLCNPVESCGVLRLDKITGMPEYKDYTKGWKKKSEAFNTLLTFFYQSKKRRLKNNSRVQEGAK